MLSAIFTLALAALASANVNSGRRAMRTATAAFGYVDPDDNPRAWAADYYLERGEDLAPLLQRLTQ